MEKQKITMEIASNETHKSISMRYIDLIRKGTAILHFRNAMFRICCNKQTFVLLFDLVS